MSKLCEIPISEPICEVLLDRVWLVWSGKVLTEPIQPAPSEILPLWSFIGKKKIGKPCNRT